MVLGQNTYIIQFDKDIGLIIDFLSHVIIIIKESLEVTMLRPICMYFNDIY
jgi:hypothetical protein